MGCDRYRSRWCSRWTGLQSMRDRYDAMQLERGWIVRCRSEWIYKKRKGGIGGNTIRVKDGV